MAVPAMKRVWWRSVSEDTGWIDGRDVVLLANGMEVSARYCPGEWSDETPDCPREYSGAVWSCFDDQFQFEIEECSKDPSEWSHGGVTHWRPALSNPDSRVVRDAGGEMTPQQFADLVLALWRELRDLPADQRAATLDRILKTLKEGPPDER